MVLSRWPVPGGERTPLATYVLLVANLVVFAAATRAGGTENPDVLRDFGALFGPLVAEGQYWRLFTAMFLHIGIPHLVMNGLSLFIFGRVVEQVFGHARFLVTYVLAGLAGSIASYASSPGVPAAGASGAIFGILGALVAYFVVQQEVFGKLGQRQLTSLLFLAAINLVYGLTNAEVDNWAHIGGFVAGIILGLVLAPRYRQGASGPGDSGAAIARLPGRIWLVVPAIMGLVVVGAYLATLTQTDSAYSHVYEAERHFARKDYEVALQETETALLIDRWNGDAYLLRGRIFAELGDAKRAFTELGNALRYGHPKTKAQAQELIPRVRASSGLGR